MGMEEIDKLGLCSNQITAFSVSVLKTVVRSQSLSSHSHVPTVRFDSDKDVSSCIENKQLL